MLFYHAGEPLTVHLLAEDGSLTTKVLGIHLAAGQVCRRWHLISWIVQVPGLAVPGGCWFTRLVDSGDPASAYSVFRCTLEW